jgi:hypothetical protein
MSEADVTTNHESPHVDLARSMRRDNRCSNQYHYPCWVSWMDTIDYGDTVFGLSFWTATTCWRIDHKMNRQALSGSNWKAGLVGKSYLLHNTAIQTVLRCPSLHPSIPSNFPRNNLSNHQPIIHSIVCPSIHILFILIEVFHGFPQSFQANQGIEAQSDILASDATEPSGHRQCVGFTA